MRWDDALNREVDSPEVDRFIEAVQALCRTWGYAIGHQDGHGAFIIRPLDEDVLEWLGEAHIDLRVPREA